MAINGIAPGIMAEECKRLGALLVHYSTNYVFDGLKPGPYTEEDQPNPVNTYGRTKLAGDMAVLASGGASVTFRVGGLFGVRGHNILTHVLRLVSLRQPILMTDHGVISPTWTRVVAEATSHFIAKFTSRHRADDGWPVSGNEMYNLSCVGTTTPFGLAKKILDMVAANEPANGARPGQLEVAPYQSLAQRPVNSALAGGKISNDWEIFCPHWEAALRLCLSSCVARLVTNGVGTLSSEYTNTPS
jgi:dTDP-4-dehydrorhamnose reductase